MTLVSTLSPRSTNSGQVARNTTGYNDPLTSALKPAPTAAQFQPSNFTPGSFSQQVKANTTGYTGAGAGTLPPQQPATDPVVQKIQQVTANAAPTAPGGGAYDLSTDPTVQAQKAANDQAYANAVAAAQSGAKQDIVGAGFDLASLLAGNPTLASSPIGSVLADQATAAAAKANPFSTAAGLANTHTKNDVAIDQAANANNLFYSSARANQLADEAHNYEGSVAGAQGTLGQALSGLLGNLATEQANENNAYANAVSTARENAITNAISSGMMLVGYDANGNPIFGAVPQTAAPAAAAASSGDSGGGSSPGVGTNVYGGANPPVAAYTPAPATVTAPYTTNVTANKTGGSANKRQGTFAIH